MHKEVVLPLKFDLHAKSFAHADIFYSTQPLTHTPAKTTSLGTMLRYGIILAILSSTACISAEPGNRCSRFYTLRLLAPLRKFNTFASDYAPSSAISNDCLHVIRLSSYCNVDTTFLPT